MNSKNSQKNILIYGDNLDILREWSKKDPFIDLIYIDPPFNSKRNYNILYEDLVRSKVNGDKNTALKEAFKDTWSNVKISKELNELMGLNNLRIYHFLVNNRSIFTSSQMNYLTMMALRIYYMRKILKESGSFYLHCDPTMSHYLKVLCDMIFGNKQFRSEITWERSPSNQGGKSFAKNFGSNSDIILFYTKTDNYMFHQQFKNFTEKQIRSFNMIEKSTGRRYYTASLRNFSEEKLREYEKKNVIYITKNSNKRVKRYLDESKNRVGSVWIDIVSLSVQTSSKERLGYPTQKPEALLERIIKASTNEGDIIADFFCGCGTTIAVAQKLHRKWIGVDISHLAINLIEQKRIKPLTKNYIIRGFPKDLASAERLAKEKPFQFEQWIVEYILQGHQTKRTGDGGFDGHLALNLNKQKLLCLIEVKGGSCTIKSLREFNGIISINKGDIGLFICFSKWITDGMRRYCDELGYIKSEGQLTVGNIPILELLTIEDILENRYPDWFSFYINNKTYG